MAGGKKSKTNFCQDGYPHSNVLVRKLSGECDSDSDDE